MSTSACPKARRWNSNRLPYCQSVPFAKQGTLSQAGKRPTQKYPTTENGNQIRFPSRRAGQRVRRDRPTQRGGWCEGRSEHHRAGEQPGGKAVGRDPAGRMILASAMRHSVGRPATGMGGGTRTYGAARQPPSGLPLKFYRYMKTAPKQPARFLSCHVICPKSGRIGREVFSWQAVPKHSRQRERKR